MYSYAKNLYGQAIRQRLHIDVFSGEGGEKMLKFTQKFIQDYEDDTDKE